MAAQAIDLNDINCRRRADAEQWHASCDFLISSFDDREELKMTATSQPSPASQPVRAAAASFVGTTIEWYDFFVYSTASALVFSQLFFPNTDATVGLLASFATFAVGFFARPFGG